MGFSLFEEVLLDFEAQGPNIKQYTEAAATVQNTMQCEHIIYDERKRTTAQIWLDHFLKRVDGIESSKEAKPVSSMSGVSEIAACPLCSIADDPSAVPSPTPSPSSNQ